MQTISMCLSFFFCFYFWFSLNFLHLLTRRRSLSIQNSHIMLRYSIYLQAICWSRERERKTFIFIRISVGVCAHIHVAKLFNLWTCFANDVNGSMQVVNVCYCSFHTSYDDNTLFFALFPSLARIHEKNKVGTNGWFLKKKKTNEHEQTG